MENLEQTLGKVLVEPRKEIETEKPKSTEYRGLKLVDDKVYAGPTSIRYWK